MTIPSDPVMLMSMLNMKLRDGEYESLDDLCLSLGIEKATILKKLSDAGFEFLPSINQFR